jgi:hypothetical protein
MDDIGSGTDLGFTSADWGASSGGSAGGGALGSWLAKNLGGLVQGGLETSAGNKNSQLAQQLFNQINQNYLTQQQYNRPDQATPFGSSKWTVDPKTGQYTQTTSLNDKDQANLDASRQLSANKLNAANSMNLSNYSKNIDWNSIGLGKLANAAGINPGGTTDSMGGYALNGPHTYTAPNAAFANSWQGGMPGPGAPALMGGIRS